MPEKRAVSCAGMRRHAGGARVRLSTPSAPSQPVSVAHGVYRPEPEPAVEGPGGVRAGFELSGARNHAAGRMATVTLTSGLDGTVYG